MPGKIKDISGQKFGSWTAVAFAGVRMLGTKKRPAALWHVRCDCGTMAVVLGRALTQKTGRSTRCKACAARAMHARRNNKSRCEKKWPRVCRECGTEFLAAAMAKYCTTQCRLAAAKTRKSQ